ncbi:MAG: carboxylesterase, partial [Pararheinheimera sp.]|nr:carboxylesterase [Rheinheimera sp.]
LSTYMAVPGKLKEEMTAANKSTAVLVNHGTHDEVVPYSAGQAAFNALKFAGFNVNWAEYRMGHSVCPQQIADISRFIQQQLPAL